MPVCPLGDLELDWCEHGLKAAQKSRAASVTSQVSPRGMAHFAGCPDRGDDDDFRQWAELDAPSTWSLLGYGEQIPATGRARPDLVASARCLDCVEHGPWF